MCELCLKQLRHEALEYFQCLYDDTSDDGPSEETYNHLMKLHEGLETHELLSMIADREKALWWNEHNKRALESTKRLIDVLHISDEEKEEGKKKLEEIYKFREIEERR